MADYRSRPATLADIETLVAQRIAMFVDMGTSLDAGALADRYRDWLLEALPTGSYRAWVVEAPSGEIVAGGGVSVVPWPPGPRNLTGRLAFVYNVYTDPAHRRRGLARLVMDDIHAWCRVNGVTNAALNASPSGQPLYETLGYRVWPQPMMIAPLDS